MNYRGNFFNGEFVIPGESNGEWIARSPADTGDEFGRIVYSYRSVDQAVQSARDAFGAWRRKSVPERAEFLKRWQTALKRREDDLANVMAREVGKPLWECKTEIAAMYNKVDVTLSDGMKFVSDFRDSKILENTAGATRFRPHGVMAVIGPFNFPGHLPNGHFVPALLTGNTIVFKPSEKAPMTGQLLAELYQEAGFPAGVFNMIQGEKEVGRRLCIHEGVDGVLFTGSYEVGVRIKQDTLLQHWKILALEMGGKNPSIVHEDADLDVAVHETLVSSFVTCGQRCSATSRIIVHRSILDAFVKRFHDAAKRFTIGHPLDNPFMGPLIDSGSVDRYLKFLGIASREGFEIIMRGKAYEASKPGNYVTPSICVASDHSVEAARKSVYQQTELFAPNVAIVAYDDIEQAVALSNVTQYGLVAGVFSKSRTVYEKCLDELEFGLVNWNKSTVGASSRLPFGGLKKSGNHWPTASAATLYCAYPLASLEVSEPKAPTASGAMPGLNWT